MTRRGWTLVLALAAGLAVTLGRADGPTLGKAQIPAFPGAEGGGAWTVGGRGGKVFVVTSLADAGPGTLREAVEAKGPRIVVFGVAGIIALERPLVIANPFLTLAGQSAPGDGICVRGHSTLIDTHDVVVRYLRFRRGNLKDRNDALGGNPVGNVIIDHVSASWGLDENLSLYRHMQKQADGSPDKKLPVENLTIQWSISSEALDLNHHAFGGTWGGKNASFHHNLFACNTGRNPSIGMSGGFDYRNNVIFNWQHRTMDGGDGSSRVNVVNNYYKPGPATEGDLRFRICKVDSRNSKDAFPGPGKWHVAGNVVEGNARVTADNWAGGVQFAAETTYKDEVIPSPTERQVRVNEPFAAAPVTTQTAEEAYKLVLAHAGASWAKRDAVDVRVIESVRTGKPSTKTGILETPADVGGWPEYKGEPLADADRDGMPDSWETAHGLNPRDPADAVNDADGDGYTNVEEYLNGTDPKRYVDYAKPENNVNALHAR